MDSPELAQRNGYKTVSAKSRTTSESTKPGQMSHPAGKAKHGSFQQAVRLVLFVMYFLGTAFVIVATQVLIAPIYFLNRHLYHSSIAITKEMFGIVLATITQWWAPTLFRVSGDASVAGQLRVTKDGMLKTSFPKRLVLIANHQIYTDWLYFWWIAYTSKVHGYIYIVLKESIKYLPILGPGMMFYEFIFLSRKWAVDESRISRAMRHLSTVYPATALDKGGLDPMWLLLFPEGTNLGRNGRNKSAAWAKKQGVNDMRHLLIPRSTGLYHSLKGLESSVDWVYDCTIAYEGIPEGQFGEEIFTLWSTYFQGRPPKSVNMYWRRFALSSIPLGDSDSFHEWLQARWDEKDQLLDQYQKTGRFPELAQPHQIEGDLEVKVEEHESEPFINTHVRIAKWTEIAEIFTPLLSVIVILSILKRYLSMLFPGR